ncbi:hypothetical protein POM88_052667 [Heracleum sosnowskyi]|uniref:Uncharacterized protein n=1 Tax=Heracleum sosnowskyi TaxID=360622 RepID=A0AAD8GRF8_9APIA|nr:hypothetical protein POM88_052667 [Heracleum sosnowskyi]
MLRFANEEHGLMDSSYRQTSHYEVVECTTDEEQPGMFKGQPWLLVSQFKGCTIPRFAWNKQEKLCEVSPANAAFATAVQADAMLQTLEKEIDDVDAKIGYPWRGLDRYCDGTVSPEVTPKDGRIFCHRCGNDGTLVAVTVAENVIVIAARRPHVSLIFS